MNLFTPFSFARVVTGAGMFFNAIKTTKVRPVQHRRTIEQHTSAHNTPIRVAILQSAHDAGAHVVANSFINALRASNSAYTFTTLVAHNDKDMDKKAHTIARSNFDFVFPIGTQCTQIMTHHAHSNNTADTLIAHNALSWN